MIWRAADGSKPGPDWLTPAEAEVLLRVLLAEAPVEQTPVSTSPSFAEVCDEWLEHGRRERRLKPSTLVDYRSAISSRILPALGSHRIDSISTAELEAWRQAMLAEGELSHRTINKHLMIVGAILEWARRRGLTEANPARNLDKLKEPRYDDLDFYEPAEIWELVQNAASQSDGTIFLLLAFSGLRRGEALALKWRDIDFERELIRVRANWSHGRLVTTKGGRVRSVPLVTPTMA